MHTHLVIASMKVFCDVTGTPQTKKTCIHNKRDEYKTPSFNRDLRKRPNKRDLVHMKRDVQKKVNALLRINRYTTDKKDLYTQ